MNSRYKTILKTLNVFTIIFSFSNLIYCILDSEVARTISNENFKNKIQPKTFSG